MMLRRHYQAAHFTSRWWQPERLSYTDAHQHTVNRCKK